MGDEQKPDTASEAPETGHPETPPEGSEPPDATAIMADAVKEHGDNAPEGPEPTAEKEETEVVDVEGADSTAMAQADPVLQALKGDERFEGHSYKTGADAVAGFAEARAKLGEFNGDRALGRDMRADWEEFQTFRSQKDDAAREQKEKEELPFNPPALPVGWAQEAMKPEAERDPEKVQAAMKHYGYVEDKWKVWANNPYQMMSELVMPSVDRLVTQRLADVHKEGELRTALEAEDAFLKDHGAEVQTLQRDGVPLLHALRLAKLEHEAKSGSATKAKANDAAALEQGRSGPTHVTPPDKVGAEDAPPDADAIIREALAAENIPVT